MTLSESTDYDSFEENSIKIETIEGFFKKLEEELNSDEIEEIIFMISGSQIGFTKEQIEDFINKQNTNKKISLLKKLNALREEKFNIGEAGLDDNEYNNIDLFLNTFLLSFQNDKNYIVNILATHLLTGSNTNNSLESILTYENKKLYKIAPNVLCNQDNQYDQSFFGDSQKSLKGNINKVFLFESRDTIDKISEKKSSLIKKIDELNDKLKDLKESLEHSLNTGEITINTAQEQISTFFTNEIDKNLEIKINNFKIVKGPKKVVHDPFSFITTENNSNEYDSVFSIEGLIVNIDEGKNDNFLKEEIGISNFGSLIENNLPVGVSKEYITILSEIIGSGLIEILGKDLGIKFSNIDFLYQIHLVRFLSISDNNQINAFKKAIKQISSEETKYAFLNTFLACSKNNEIGAKITELSSVPGSDTIFKEYAALINLQSEKGLQGFIKILLSRGEGLLLKAYGDSQSLQEGESLESSSGTSKDLVKSGLLAKKLLKQDDSKNITVQEFNEANIGFNISLQIGKDLLHSTNILDTMSEENYPDTTNFSKEDFLNISDRIKASLENKDDLELPNIILKSLIKDLQNKKSHFIFLKNDLNKLMGICKIIENDDGSFYYGTHYLHPDLMGDFSLGSALQNILENETNKGNTLEATVKIDNEESIIRHIEYTGGVATRISQISKSEFLDFNIRSTDLFITKNNSLQTKEDFRSLGNNVKVTSYLCPIQEEQNLLLSDGYALTRIIMTNQEKFMVFEKLEGVGEFENSIKAA